jgi:hypothetical protein
MYGVYVCLTYGGQKSKPIDKKHGIKSEDVKNMDLNTHTRARIWEPHK